MPFLSDLRAMLLAGVAVLCLGLALVQTIRLDGFLWIDGVQDKLERVTIDNNELRAELKAISDKRNEQAERTKVIIREVEKRIKVADKQAEKVENAPLPGNCATPAEIMGADL